MKRARTIIPTLIALTAACAAAPSLQAQTPTRQQFPWSSSRVAETVSRVKTAVAKQVPSSTKVAAPPFRQTIGNATSISNDVLSVGETIYLDESGNQITREQMQAKLSAGQNQIASIGESIRTNRTSFLQHTAPLQSANTSAWGKAKSVNSKATSFFKKPSLFKTPEGMTLPSMKTTWGKPKFDQPTKWFSKTSTDPITFAPLESLPRRGKIPTSIDGPLTAPPRRFARQVAAPAQFPSLPANNFASTGDAAGQSIFSAAEYEVAESVNSNSFDPRR